MVGGLSEQLRLEAEVVLDLTLAGRRVSDDGVANPRTNKGQCYCRFAIRRELERSK